MAAMLEREVSITDLGNQLAGTLCLPDPTRPAALVLMLHGTGPLDRNENMPGQRLDVFNTLSHGLCELGYASVRYDKRGCGKSTGDYKRAGHADLVADAVAWVDAIRAHGWHEPGRLFLLGHSEGCLIAPQVSRQRESVAGLILLCPTIQPIEAVLMQQAAQIERELTALSGLRGIALRALTRLLGSPVETQRRLIDRLKSTTSETLRHGLRKIEARALRELIALDTHAALADVGRPMLLIGGEKDLQCQPEDVSAIAALNTGAEALVIPNLTHLLRLDPGPASILAYTGLLKQPVAPELVAIIARWLIEQETGAC
jgi:pimeloyl-ACP methyl ester carboxylesterase